LNNYGIPQKRVRGVLADGMTKASIRCACLSTIDKKTYKTIYTLFTLLNPLCLAIFLFFADRINGFQTRYISEFESQSIELRKFSLQASNIPNATLMRKTLNGAPVTQQQYETAVKQALWMHFERMI